MYIEYKKYKYVMIYTGSDIFVMTRISKTIIFGLKVVIQEVVITSVFFDWAVDSYPPIIISLNQLNFRLSPCTGGPQPTQRNDPVMIRVTTDGHGHPYWSLADDDDCLKADLTDFEKLWIDELWGRVVSDGNKMIETEVLWFKLKRNEIVLTQLEWLKYLICSKGLSNM